jgi:hypothetical protein
VTIRLVTSKVSVVSLVVVDDVVAVVVVVVVVVGVGGKGVGCGVGC